MASRKDITNDVSSTPDENEYPSGFPQSICDQTPHEKYLCSNCNSVLNKARQTACGHRYCLACVNWLVRNNKTPVCKKCKEEEPKADNEASILTLDNSFSDAAITKEILELRVHCANHRCPWSGVLRDFEEHQTQCDYALIPCNVGCGHMVLRKALATHLEKGCPKTTSSCPACSQTLTLAQLPGTTEKVREHESSSHVSHLQLLLRAVQSLPPSTSTSSQPPLALPSQLSSPGAGSLDPLLEVDGGEGGGGRCQEEMSLAHSLREDQAAAAAAVVGQQLDSVQERVCVFENIISALSREVEKAQLCMAALERDHHSNQDVINFLEAKIAEQQQRLVMKEGLVSALQLRVSALQEVSYDGTFLWRVPDINQKLQEAAQGQRSSLYSPAFYTSRYGFKVCLRLYLNGDGVGRGTHISLFFVIMRGEYDALLTWPFRHKVTFFLIDQNQREHVLDAFRPDLSSASFKRPTSDMNVASGCPCFCPLSKLSSPKYAYCKGNTLFVKCVVDTSS
ncbi:hypothetical protein AALO_G00073600 [Alosa alosa]|uniref:TNF receptor-associated factor n=1 Tax=Alosa alosa TaxID=278164 RepID=A0AAV6H6X7_9TELE|nr:hypothetical protein AALO_G00073600 [Alosa alosa]